MERKCLQCVDFPLLGAGWKREVHRRETGMLTGKEDVYYRSPTGVLCRDQSAVVEQLDSISGGRDPTGRPFDWPAFDFELGRLNPSITKFRAQSQQTAARDELSSYLRVPIRQTGVPSSAAKVKINAVNNQSPYVIRNRDDQVKESFGNRTGKPLQLFWFKRLEEERQNLSSMRDAASSDAETHKKQKTAVASVLPEELESAHSQFGEKASLYSLLTAIQEHGSTLLVGQMHSAQPALGGTDAARHGGSRLDEDVSFYYTSTQPFIKPAKVRQEVVQAHAKQVVFLRDQIAALSRRIDEKRKRTQDEELEQLTKQIDQREQQQKQSTAVFKPDVVAETKLGEVADEQNDSKRLKLSTEPTTDAASVEVDVDRKSSIADADDAPTALPHAVKLDDSTQDFTAAALPHAVETDISMPDSSAAVVDAAPTSESQ